MASQSLPWSSGHTFVDTGQVPLAFLSLWLVFIQLVTTTPGPFLPVTFQPLFPQPRGIGVTQVQDLALVLLDLSPGSLVQVVDEDTKQE